MAPDPEAACRPGRGELVSVLTLALALLLWSWSRVEGYPLADVVEDLEWTEALLAGEHVVDSEATRPFGFLLILSPLILLGRAVAALTGGAAVEVAMQLARLYAIGASLLLVALTMRFAARAGERASALAAGILLASNPLLLRWGIEPISDVTTGIFLLLAADIAFFRQSDGSSPARRGLWCGLCLGAAVLTAYKSIAIAAPLVAGALAFGPRLALARGPLLLGLAACLLAQSAGDWLYHGAFGESLRLYFLQNMGNIVPAVIHRAGEWLGSDGLKGLARRLYEAGRAAHLLEPPPVAMHQAVADVTSMQSRTWYATHLHQALTWPGLALAAAGLLRALRQRRWALLLPAGAVVFYAVLMSYKGSKDFRLWLPVLPFVAATGAFGAAGLATRGGPAPALAALALLGSAVLGPLAHARVEQRQFAGYWRALAHVERAERERAEGEPRPRVASGFHWAVYGRAGPAIELVKLPRHLDGWEHHTEAERAESLRALAALDVFIAHQGLVERRAELCLALGRDFEVTAAFFRPESETTPGPVLVFERRGEEARGGLLLARRARRRRGALGRRAPARARARLRGPRQPPVPRRRADPARGRRVGLGHVPLARIACSGPAPARARHAGRRDRLDQRPRAGLRLAAGERLARSGGRRPPAQRGLPDAGPLARGRLALDRRRRAGRPRRRAPARRPAALRRRAGARALPPARRPRRKGGPRLPRASCASAPWGSEVGVFRRRRSARLGCARGGRSLCADNGWASRCSHCS